MNHADKNSYEAQAMDQGDKSTYVLCIRYSESLALNQKRKKMMKGRQPEAY